VKLQAPESYLHSMAYMDWLLCVIPAAQPLLLSHCCFHPHLLSSSHWLLSTSCHVITCMDIIYCHFCPSHANLFINLCSNCCQLGHQKTSKVYIDPGVSTGVYIDFTGFLMSLVTPSISILKTGQIKGVWEPPLTPQG
jgi:hypothetical protein